MDINKLFLFVKGTDAVASQRGYNYQTLKTLETWIANYIAGKNEDIYCEYEEDIFQKDKLTKKLRFRQVKLYTDGFSFGSEEIRKSLGHFFILHTKLDYSDFDKEFVFETNTRINSKYADNDAELLKEWFEKQYKLDEDLTARIAEKVKAVVGEYVGKQTPRKDQKEAFEDAISAFNSLDDDYWKRFSGMIRWNFLSVPPEVEFDEVRKRIENLVGQLPYPASQSGPVQAFGVLLDVVFRKLTEKNHEDRLLNNFILEQTMLDIGDSQDKWYGRRAEYYISANELDEFRIGEFSEILDLANYCRRKSYLHGHSKVWQPLLSFYARNDGILNRFRRQAVYELVFLCNKFHEVDYANLDRRDRPVGSLIGIEEDIRFYFADLSVLSSSSDLEDAQTLVKVIFAAVSNQLADISMEELRRWFVSIYREVTKKLKDECNVNERCCLLETKGIMLMSINRIRSASNVEFIGYFKMLLDLVEDAPLFQLSRFGERIEKYIKIQIQNDPGDKMGITACLEDFSEKLFPLLEKRDGRIQLAKTQVKRAYTYVQTRESRNLLKALEYFHKAKDNFLLEDTIDEYIGALLSVAFLYNGLGMHFAAKNYALAAFRVSANREIVGRVESSLAMLLNSDLSAGAWFNALIVFSQYINLRLESNFDRLHSEEEIRCTNRVAFTLYVMNKTSMQFGAFIQNYFGFLDYVGEEIIQPMQDMIEKQYADDDTFSVALGNFVDDFPLNDIGKVRAVSFYALGSLWCVRFENSFEYIAIAEEYISAIQVILAEIALSDIDFHLVRANIDIQLVLSVEHLQPEQLPSNEIIKWKIFIHRIESEELYDSKFHSAYIMTSLKTMLNDISLLKSEEFEKLFMQFFLKAKLDTKQWAVNLYQKIHRDVYRSIEFQAFKPEMFNKIDFNGLNMPRENSYMIWDKSLSGKYNRNLNIAAIKNRFDNVKKSTYLTIEKLKNDVRFPDWVRKNRENGWKDWQIVINIHNFMVNYKVTTFEGREFNSEAGLAEHYQKMFSKYHRLDEADCYVIFPLEAFMTREFYEQYNVSLPSILQSYGLETKQMTPNFDAIKEFLTVRFNLGIDDYNENNPLSSIH